MQFDNFSDRSQGFIQVAQSLALGSGHQQLKTEHLLHALLSDSEGLCAGLIKNAGGSAQIALEKCTSALERIPKVEGSGAGTLHLEAALARVFDSARKQAKASGDSFVTAEMLLLALLEEGKGEAHKALSSAAVDADKLKSAIAGLRKGKTADTASAETSYDALKRYSRDLTASAKDGKLDPVIGRDEEIRRTIQVLSRRTKNNPVLIGEPGVGKTAIAEGLALRIVNGDVPQSLRGKQLLALDLGSMVAGAKFRGEFEERLKSVLHEIEDAEGEILCFIDELHSLIGAGAVEGTMDASNMLKPALARGTLHCIGATTLDEYRKHIEKDAALARRFQPVLIEEPSTPDAISILRGIKEKYEVHHGVRISDSAIISAVTLSHRYISDRFLPDKAIDLMDEAASRLRMTMDSKPEEIDELDRRIMRLKIEREALKIEKDATSKERLAKLRSELSVLEEQSLQLTSKWQAEISEVQESKNLQSRLESARNELEMAERSAQYERAGQLTYGIIPDLEQKLALREHSGGDKMINESVDVQDIAAVVGRWTGIPVARILEGEREKLLHMDSDLRKRVVGQDEAVKAVSDAVRRGRAGLQDPHRPIGSFLFLGPTGVGKTELCKALAQFLFADDAAIVRIDMSEYMEKHSVARLIGAPPGYVGYEEGGALTEAVRRKPYQLVLFDEVEKAHADVFNILLQVLDDGRLTDSHGRTVDFSNTVIIMTSNAAAELFQDYRDDAGVDSVAAVRLRSEVMQVLRGYFRPEFLNRIDEILLFHKLNRKDMSKIVDIQIANLQDLLGERRIVLQLDAEARQWLADKGYDPVFGARPLKRVIQQELQNKLAEQILSGRIGEDCYIQVGCGDDGLVFNSENPPAIVAEDRLTGGNGNLDDTRH